MVLKWLDCKRVVQICKPSEEIIPHSHSPTATGVNYRIDSDEEAKKNGEEEYKKVSLNIWALGTRLLDRSTGHQTIYDRENDEGIDDNTEIMKSKQDV